MAECRELETLVYCVGAVGGIKNPVVTHASDFKSKYDYTTRAYARYIQEAKNVIRFHICVTDYFLESVESEFGEEDPLAFIDTVSEEDLAASIDKMKKQWKEMFKDHQKTLRDSLRKQKEAYEQSSDDSSSSSSAKISRLDPEAADAGPEYTFYGGMPVEEVDFPDSILDRVRAFVDVVKNEFQALKERLGKALDAIIPDTTAHDLKGFSLKRMEKFAKWRFSLKTLYRLVSELEKEFGDLELDFYKIKSYETRLTRWVSFDDGKGDKRYHHRLLIPMDLTNSVAEISTLAYKQLQRWEKMVGSLRKELSEEHEKFIVKQEGWRLEILSGMKMDIALTPQESVESDDTSHDISEDISEET